MPNHDPPRPDQLWPEGVPHPTSPPPPRVKPWGSQVFSTDVTGATPASTVARGIPSLSGLLLSLQPGETVTFRQDYTRTVISLQKIDEATGMALRAQRDVTRQQCELSRIDIMAFEVARALAWLRDQSDSPAPESTTPQP